MNVPINGQQGHTSIIHVHVILVTIEPIRILLTDNYILPIPGSLINIYIACVLQ